MYAHYTKPGTANGTGAAWGLLKWNDALNMFEELTPFPEDSVFREPTKGAQSAFLKPGAAGQADYVYFGTPFPFVRAPATQTGLADLTQCVSTRCAAH